MKAVGSQMKISPIDLKFSLLKLQVKVMGVGVVGEVRRRRGKITVGNLNILDFNGFYLNFENEFQRFFLNFEVEI